MVDCRSQPNVGSGKSPTRREMAMRTRCLAAAALNPGTQMIRQWQNTSHTVTALVDGFEWNGRTYKSLSAVANAITGTNWNGFSFFGIKRAPSGNKNASGSRRTNSRTDPDVGTVPVSKVKSMSSGRNA